MKVLNLVMVMMVESNDGGNHYDYKEDIKTAYNGII